MDEIKYKLTNLARDLGIKFLPPRRGDAGYDLYYSGRNDVAIMPSEQVLLPTGVSIAIPFGYYGKVYDRSSMAAKRLYASAGVIDSSYRGEIMVVMRYDPDDRYYYISPQSRHDDTAIIRPGDKIAQIVIQPVLAWDTVLCDDLSETERGIGGFGSTGN